MHDDTGLVLPDGRGVGHHGQPQLRLQQGQALGEARQVGARLKQLNHGGQGREFHRNAHLAVGSLFQHREQAPRDFPVMVQDGPGIGCQIGGGHLPLARQGMLRACHDSGLHLEQRCRHEKVRYRVHLGQRAEVKVEFTRQKAWEVRFGQARVQLETEMGVALAQCSDRPGHEGGSEEFPGANPDAPRLPGAERLQFQVRDPALGVDTLRMGQQGLPVTRQGDASRQALEKLDAKFGLEALDALGQRRLRQRQRMRGAAQAAFPDDGEELAQQGRLAQDCHDA
jgi:hypothetical protein